MLGLVVCRVVVVCGGANAGHYTAYTRHCVTNDWFYSNDETIVKQTPHDADYSNMYILFYRRRGPSSLLCPLQFATSSPRNR